MRWFCRHDWKLQAQTFAPPREHGLRSIKGVGAADLLERAQCGVTTALLTCARCGAVEKHSLLGRPDEGHMQRDAGGHG